MFEVRASYVFDFYTYLEIQTVLFEAAGRKSDFAGTMLGGRRDHGWYERKLDDAVAMRKRIEESGIETIAASVRESSHSKI